MTDLAERVDAHRATFEPMWRWAFAVALEFDARSRGLQVYTYAWGNNPRRAELKGRRCVIEVRGGTMGTALVRFLDTGERVTTSVRALRRAKEDG